MIDQCSSLSQYMNQPFHWKKYLFKNCVSIRNGSDYKDIETNEGIPVIGSGGQFAYCSQIMYEGEVIFLGRKGTIDRPLYYNGPFWAVDTMFYAIPNPGFSGKFLYYLATCFPYKAISTQTALPSMTQTALKGLEVYMPEYEEQQRIVKYLDEKTKAIDVRISVLEKKSDAYTRLKASVINRAVTRGLNPNVKLKDSGIEWIGKIPEHWEVKRMKEIFTERKEVSNTGQEDLLSVSEYYGVARRKDKMTSDEEYESRAESLVGYKICKTNDLVMNIMLAWKTGLGFSDYDGIVSPAYAVYKGKNIVPHYYHYLMRSGMYVTEYKRHSRGIIDSRLRLYNDKFCNISAIYPSIDEQQSIATYLDNKCSEIDTAIENVEKQIGALKRLKRSLINEVVTGKRIV